MLHKAIPPARNDHWVGKPYSAGAAGRRRVIARIHRNTLPRNDVGQFKFIDAAPESHARHSAVWPPLIGRVSLRLLAGPIVTLWVIPVSWARVGKLLRSAPILHRLCIE